MEDMKAEHPMASESVLSESVIRDTQNDNKIKVTINSNLNGDISRTNDETGNMNKDTKDTIGSTKDTDNSNNNSTRGDGDLAFIPSNSDVSTSTSTSTSTNTNTHLTSNMDSRGLRFAPPELRQMIFRHMFCRSPKYCPRLQNFEFPAIITVLKEDDILLYKEAMEAFTKSSRIEIDWREPPLEVEGYFNSCPIKYIQTLDIHCQFVKLLHFLLDFTAMDYRQLKWHSQPDDVENQPSATTLQVFEKARHQVRTVNMTIKLNIHDSQADDDIEDEIFLSKVIRTISSFPNLQKLKIHLRALADYYEYDDEGDTIWDWGYREPKWYPDIFGKIDNALLVKTSTYEDKYDFPSYWIGTWRARPGKSLEWNPEGLEDEREDRCVIDDVEVHEEGNRWQDGKWSWGGPGCKIHNNDLFEYLYDHGHNDPYGYW